MTKGEMHAILRELDSREVPDSAELGVLMVNGEICKLNPNEFRVEREDTEIKKNAADQFEGRALQPRMILLKQV